MDNLSAPPKGAPLSGNLIRAPRLALLAVLAIAAALLWLAPAEPTHAQTQTDNTRPTITFGPILNSPPTGDTYRSGDTITVAMTFSESVNVSGDPRVRLTIGKKKRWASYVATVGDGDTLQFAYTVKSKDKDEDGVSIGKNSLKLNGGSIVDDADNRAKLKHAAMPDSSNHKVKGATDLERAQSNVPTVSSITITSSPSDGTDTYGANELITFTVTFSERVDVTEEGLWLTFDSGGKSLTAANREPATSRRNIILRGTVSYDVSDTNGISISQNSLRSSSSQAVVASDDATAANLNHSAVAASSSHKVDHTKINEASKVRAYITQIDSLPIDGRIYRRGQQIWVTITFYNKVKLASGTNQDVTMALQIGDETRTASLSNVNYAGGTFSVYRFIYKVAADDLDHDGVTIPANAIALAAGATLEHAGNSGIGVILDHDAVAAHHRQKVNGSDDDDAVGYSGPATRFVFTDSSGDPNDDQSLYEGSSSNQHKVHFYVEMGGSTTAATTFNFSTRRLAGNRTNDVSLSSNRVTIPAGGGKSSVITVTGTDNSDNDAYTPGSGKCILRIELSASVSNDNEDVKPPAPEILYILDDESLYTNGRPKRGDSPCNY